MRPPWAIHPRRGPQPAIVLRKTQLRVFPFQTGTILKRVGVKTGRDDHCITVGCEVAREVAPEEKGYGCVIAVKGCESTSMRGHQCETVYHGGCRHGIMRCIGFGRRSSGKSAAGACDAVLCQLLRLYQFERAGLPADLERHHALWRNRFRRRLHDAWSAV